jgi:hypothetical protein
MKKEDRITHQILTLKTMMAVEDERRDEAIILSQQLNDVENQFKELLNQVRKNIRQLNNNACNRKTGYVMELNKMEDLQKKRKGRKK